ncbi:hypothetical protein ACNOYE_05675 [Nannocystaceae bacterium ST9]
MNQLSSSRDLHPETGARFVFERVGEPPRYSVQIYLPGGRGWAGELDWVEGQARVQGPEAAGDEALAWALDELIKLARVLHRDPKPRLVRWRG